MSKEISPQLVDQLRKKPWADLKLNEQVLLIKIDLDDLYAKVDDMDNFCSDLEQKIDEFAGVISEAGEVLQNL